MNAAMAISIGPFSGGLFNPARSLGSLAVMKGIASNDALLMMLTPFAGCSLAMWIYQKTLISEELEDELDDL